MDHLNGMRRFEQTGVLLGRQPIGCREPGEAPAFELRDQPRIVDRVDTLKLVMSPDHGPVRFVAILIFLVQGGGSAPKDGVDQGGGAASKSASQV